jgi:drug/metabolite transporter (DMT)-like permease
VGLTEASPRWIGPACAVLGVLGFSFKAILIKLAYAWHPVDAVTLLALRMLFAAPFFIAMAIFSTVLPTWLIAEAIRRLGANTSSLIGSLGPVFTIGLGALILGEPVHAIQLVGAALVLVGVALVTLQPSRARDTTAKRAAGIPDT